MMTEVILSFIPQGEDNKNQSMKKNILTDCTCYANVIIYTFKFI